MTLKFDLRGNKKRVAKLLERLRTTPSIGHIEIKPISNITLELQIEGKEDDTKWIETIVEELATLHNDMVEHVRGIADLLTSTV